MPVSLPQNFNQEYDKAPGDGVPKKDLDRVDPGTYLAFVYDVRSKTINDKQAIEIVWQVVSKVDGEESDQTQKKTIGEPFYLTTKAMWRLTAFMKMLKVTCSDRQVFNPEALIGRFASVEVDVDSWTAPSGDMVFLSKVKQCAPPSDPELNKEERDASDPKWPFNVEQLRNPLPF